MRYRREIDGLRAVAVLPVILFHGGFEVFSGGFVGVDVFFVISGYLITTILIGERAAGTYSLLGFYERRARRILPALFLVLAACLPLAWLRMPPYLFEDFARSLLFAALFGSNVHFWEFTGYFQTSAELKPLLHTWSLAVEEQYYLLFPLMLMALGRFRRARFLAVLGIVAALSLGLSEWGWRNYPEENFFFTFSRFWELLAGSLCAVWLYRREPRRSEGLAALGLGLIVWSMLAYDSLVPFPSVWALAPVGGTMLIILFARADTLTARALSLGPVVGVGLISYSAYLWHQPLFVFARIWSSEPPSAALMAGLAGLSLGLAWLSWRFVELPFRNRAHPLLRHRGALFGASLAGIAAFAAVGAQGMATEGFRGRLEYASTPYFDAILASFDDQPDFGSCFTSGSEGMEYITPCALWGAPDADRVLGVMGDSHAVALLPAFEAVADRLGATILAGALPACPPLAGVRIGHGLIDSDLCERTVETQMRTLIDARVEAVFLVSRWTLFSVGDYAGFHPKFALAPEGGEMRREPGPALAAFKAGLQQTVRIFTKAGIKVVLVNQVPQQREDPRTVLERALLLRLNEADTLTYLARSFIDAAAHEALQAPVRAALAALSGPDVAVVTLDDVFARDGRFAWIEGRHTLYGDDDHLSLMGARRAGPALAEAAARFLGER